MNTKLSMVKTTVLAFGAALLMVGVALLLLGVTPIVQAGTDAHFSTLVDSGSVRLTTADPVTDTHLSDRDLTQGNPGARPTMPAATYQVTNTNASGPGSLYQAILDTNTNAGADTITFAPSVNGTIVLTGSLPAITDTLTIIGPGVNVLAVSGANAYRVFTINAGVAVNMSGLTIRDGNANGSAGGGIISAGTLVLNNTNIVSNSADFGGGVFQGGSGRVDISNSLIEFNHSGSQGGGLYISGDAALTNTLVLTNTAGADGGGITDWAGRTDLIGGMFAGNSAGGNGGGVNVNNSLSVNGTQFISNTAANGGGLLQWNAGYPVMITNARFQGNHSGNTGGGLYVRGNAALSGVQIFSNTATGGGGITGVGILTVTNSTVSGNRATDPIGGGGAVDQRPGGTSTIINSTLVSNTAATASRSGIWLEAGTLTLTIRNSIVAFNNWTNNVQVDGGTFTSLGYNLTNSGAGTPFTATGDLINSNPQLGPLQNNGGSTWTYALLPGSPAIDKGDPAFAPPSFYDQRGLGFSRKVNGRIDIGAFEVQASGPCYAQLVSNSNTFTNTDATAVQDAVDVASNNDTVKVAGTCTGVQSRTGLSQTVYISRSLTVRGGYTSANWYLSDPIANPTVLDAMGGGRVVYLTGTIGVNILLENLAVRNGLIVTPDNGGGVLNNFSVLKVSNVILSGNSAYMGGGIRNEQGALTVVNSTFVNNNSSIWGGGIGNYSGTLSVSNSSFADNVSGSWGGGVATNGTLTVTNSAFTGNSATNGGGLYVYLGPATVINSTFSGNSSTGNTASNGGGAIEYNLGGPFIALTRNDATNGHRPGSGQATDETTVIASPLTLPVAAILNTTIVSNTAANVTRSGIWVVSGTVTIQNSIVAQNSGTNNVQVDGGTFTSLGHNLTNSSAGAPFTAIGDLVNTSPLLGPLQDNGGSSWTHALLTGSPAIDQIPFSTNGCGTSITTDQRGWGRPWPMGGQCDIGAYEVHPAICVARFGAGTTYSSGDAAALQAAVDAASTGDTIKVAGTCAGVEQRAGFSQTVYIARSLTVRGGYTSANWITPDPIANPTVLDARSSGRVVNVIGGNVTLENLTARGGSTTGNFGSGIYNEGTLLLNNMSIISNTSAAEGGGVFNAGTLTVTNSTVSGNRAASWGGGIGSIMGRLTLVNSTLSRNQVTGTVAGGGGALDLYALTNATIINCTIVSNTAGVTNTSGIYLESTAGPLTIQNSIVAHNGVTNNLAINGTAFTSLGYNLTNSGAGTPFTATGDLINTNPLLGPLQDNGGSSWTHALLPGSPALNRIPDGTNGCGTTITTDQRGWPRPFPPGGQCDIGAFEAVFKIYLPVVIK